MIRSSVSSAANPFKRRHGPRFLPSVSFSSESSTVAEDETPADSATIIQGPSLLASTGVHRPSPSMFHLPGLRSLPFWTAPGPSSPPSSSSTSSSQQQQQQQRRHRIAFNDPIVTSAVEHVESNYEAIRAEYFSAVLGQGYEINPQDSSGVAQHKPMEPDYDVASKGGEHAEDALHSGTWDWHSYILNGVKNEKFKERCPKTAQVIDDLEKERMLFGTPFGFCFFSTLHGKSTIKAHSGPMNLRLRMHLPLMVPSKAKKEYAADDPRGQLQSSLRPTAGIKVADQTREWHEGSAMILDDSYMHEVWNDSEESRVLLLLDLWHPDVGLEERERIANMFDYARGKGWIGNKAGSE